MHMGEIVVAWWHTLEVQITALLGVMCVVLTIPWILMSKKDSISALAWCMIVFFLPFVGTCLYLIFGYQHVNVPLNRKRQHQRIFSVAHSNIFPKTATTEYQS